MYGFTARRLLLALACFVLFVTVPNAVHGDVGNFSVGSLLSLYEELRLPLNVENLPSVGSRYVAGLASMDEEDVKCMNGGIEKAGGCVCPDLRNFSGLRCEMCERNSACAAYVGNSGECRHSLSIRGSNKQFECHLDSPLVAILGGGRKIKAVVTLNCSTIDGTAFSAGENGVCAMTLFRIELQPERVDPFFHCKTSQCSMRLVTEGKNDQSSASPKSHRAFKIWTLTGQMVLVLLCTLISLLRCISSKLGYRRKAKIVIGLATALVVATLLFIGVMFIIMRPKIPEVYAIYECKKTECHCANSSPDVPEPVCSKTVVNDKILPLIQNDIRYACNLRTGACHLTLTDISLLFDLQCNASECVNTSEFANEPKIDPPEIQVAQRNLLVLLIIAMMLVMVTCAISFIRASAFSRKKAAEFVRLFGLSEPQVQLEGVPFTVEENCGGCLDLNNNNNNILPRRKHGVQQSRDFLGSECVKHDPSTTTTRSSSNEIIGLAFHNRVSGPYSTTSDARRIFIPTANETDRIEFYRRLTRSPFELMLKDLEYALPASRFAAVEESAARQLLHRVNLKVRSGEVLAIIGPSGAGKTTLLDLLSVRSKQGQTLGTISLNGTPVNTNSEKCIKLYRNIMGYVSQEDTLLPSLTVYQTIEYAARLKLPRAFSNTTIKSIVRHMIEMLKLERCEHTVIGDGSGLRGVSGGEKRRVSIAVELLANPRILFLDEPTSGLDALSAKRVIEAVVGLAKESPMQAYAPYYFAFKPIVIFSIHQPSQEIFELFDKLLLLSRGVSVYCGPACRAAESLEKRIGRLIGGVRDVPRLADHPNHAEYLMKLEEVLDDTTRMEIQEEDEDVASGENRHEGTEFFQECGREGNNSDNCTHDDSEELIPGDDILSTVASFRVYYANVYQQLSLLTSRAACCLISSFHLIACHTAVTACVGVLMMVLYNEQNLDLPGALNRAGSITFLLLVVSFVSLSCLENLVTERKLFVLERENGFYSVLPYLLSKIFVDILPLRVVPAMVLASLIYFPMGFRVDDGAHFFWFVLVVVLFSICITLLVLCIGVVTGSFGAAALLSSVVILWNFVFGGFLVQAETVPAPLRPFQALSPFFLAFEALLVNELDGQACTFTPTDETGKEAATSIPIMCVQYLSNIGLKPRRFNGDVAMLAGFIVLLTCTAWLLFAKFTNIVR